MFNLHLTEFIGFALSSLVSVVWGNVWYHMFPQHSKEVEVGKRRNLTRARISAFCLQIVTAIVLAKAIGVPQQLFSCLYRACLIGIALSCNSIFSHHNFTHSNWKKTCIDMGYYITSTMAMSACLHYFHSTELVAYK